MAHPSPLKAHQVPHRDDHGGDGQQALGGGVVRAHLVEEDPGVLVVLEQQPQMGPPQVQKAPGVEVARAGLRVLGLDLHGVQEAPVQPPPERGFGQHLVELRDEVWVPPVHVLDLRREARAAMC